MKPTSERLSAARAVAVRIAKEIEFFQEGRRLALLADDDESATRADEQLVKLALAGQRAADKIAMLESEAAAEQRKAQEWPQDLQATRARIAELQQRHDALTRKPQINRSAADQAELDNLGPMIGTMRRHASILEGLAA